MANQISIRKDTYNNWVSANPVLKEGELGYDITLNKIKVGDGSTAWGGLKWLSASSDVNAVKRVIFQAPCSLSPSLSGSTVYLLNSSGSTLTSSGNGLSGISSFATFSFQASDYSMYGLTTKLSLRVIANVNGVAPGNTITFGLYPVTVGGASNVVTGTAGTVVTGSTCAFVTPSASTTNTLSSGTFTAPSDGSYVIGVLLSDVMAANSYVQARAYLQVSYV